MKRTENVSKMLENFMELHNEGYTIPEIAQKYNVEKSTVYHLLQQIADANGVTRESLLQIVHSNHVMTKARISKATQVNPEELKAAFERANKEVKNLTRIVDQILEGE